MEAIRAYEQVLELFPHDAEAGKALEQRYVAAHRHAELAELLEKRLGFCEDVDEAVALRFRLATLYDEDLADADRAVENYRAALGGDPTHAGAIRALEKYLDDDGQRVAAAEVLEPTYVARHDWPALVRIYQIRLEAADDHRTRLVLVKRIARLYEEQLEDLEGAFTWYAKVFREEPSDRQTRDQLARLAGVLDNWMRLADVYEGYLADDGAGVARQASRCCARWRPSITGGSRTSTAPRRRTSACSSSTPTTRRRSSTSSSSCRAPSAGPICSASIATPPTPRSTSRARRRCSTSRRRCTRTSSPMPTPPSTPGARSSTSTARTSAPSRRSIASTPPASAGTTSSS